MTRYIAGRLVYAVVVVYIVATLSFFMLYATADPVAVMLAGTGATPAQVTAIKHSLGYDQPLVVQYLHFLARITHGDFGVSARYGQSCLSLVLQHLPYTIELDVVALVLSLLVAFPIGMLSAVRRGSAQDRIGMMVAAAGQSVPSFVWGPIFILVFAVGLRLLPVAGASDWRAVILPAVTLALYPMARIARLLRSSVLDVLSEQYVMTARAKGVTPAMVIWVHVLRNALLPVLTMLGLQIAALLGGTIVVETIYGWPGLGYFAEQALLNADFPLVQTIIIFITAGVVLVNILTDIAYGVADPRIRYS